MSFVRTTSSSGGSLPEHMRGLSGDIDARQQRIIRRVAAAHAEEVFQNTPQRTGLLASDADPPRGPGLGKQDVTGDHVYTAPANDPAWRTGESAPGGTIKAFVEWYISAFGKRPGYPSGVHSWHTLDEPGDETNKNLLRAFRLGGDTSMGGAYPPPVYFGAVNQGLVPGGPNAGNITKNMDFADQIALGIKAKTEWILNEEMGR